MCVGPSIANMFLFALILFLSAGHTNPLRGQSTLPPVTATPETKDSDSDKCSLPSCIVDTSEFADVVKRVQEESQVHGAEKVLLVVDVDNTTLAMNQPLGSDQWYNWQYNFIYQQIESPHRVARDLDELLDIQGTLFALGKMRPPQPDLPTMVRQLQDSGCSTVVLTSRGPEFRDATERELDRNGYDFRESAPIIFEPVRGSFLPYDKDVADVDGLTAEELATLRDPRPVSYGNGIYMTAGQHKGFMLRTLLARTDREFKAIVFVDDHDKHTQRMSEAFKNSGITTACFHYTREQPAVDDFDKSDKEAVSNQWRSLKSVLSEIFGD